MIKCAGSVEFKAALDKLQDDVSVVFTFKYEGPVIEEPSADRALCKQDPLQPHVSDIFYSFVEFFMLLGWQEVRR